MGMIANYRRLSTDQLAQLRQDPNRVPAFLYDEAADPDDQLDLNKSWHAIHFLLTGHAWEGSGPLHGAVLGGSVLGDQDLGLGPARYLTAEEVREVASALVKVSASELLNRFDAASLNAADIYPQGWTSEQVHLDYIKSKFVRLVEFFRTASDRGQAMLLYIN